MSKRIKAPPPPKVQLSLEDAHELRVLSADLEREFLRSYEDFLYQERRQVDTTRWKEVRTQEDIRVFKERSSSKQSENDLTQSTRGTSWSTVEIGPQSAMAANSSMPTMMVTGTMPGMLDDAMYGTTFHDTSTLRARNSYQKTNNEDSAVLNMLEGPTFDDPYRFLGLTWYYKSYPIGIISNRDLVMLMAVHGSQLSTGEPIGVSMYHSIQHRDAPELREQSVLRAEFSLCTLFRQIDDNRLDIFMMCFVEPHGSTPESLMVQDTAKSLLSVTEACDVAFRRKLFFRMREAQRQRTRSASRGDQDSEKNCALCNKSFGGLFSSSGSTCQICSKRVCSKCSTTRNIIIETTNAAITAKPFDFCIVCTLDTKEIPSETVARDEQYERTSSKTRQPIRSGNSSTSSQGSI